MLYKEPISELYDALALQAVGGISTKTSPLGGSIVDGDQRPGLRRYSAVCRRDGLVRIGGEESVAISTIILQDVGVSDNAG